MSDTLTPVDASTETTKSDVFKPTPAMAIWIDTAMRLESDSPTEIAEACEPKLDRTNWYRWLEQPGFIDWFNSTWNERIKGHAWRLDVIGMRNSKKDFNYWKSMQQRVGNLIEKQGPSTLIQNNFNASKYIKDK